LKKAKKFAKLVKEGKNLRKHKTHTKVRFFRPKTLKLKRNGKYARSIESGVPKNVESMKTSIILQPVTTEKAMKKMEDEHTMVFMVKPEANKRLIKEAF
jgi:large subunit ribosomal protein L23Ae